MQTCLNGHTRRRIDHLANARTRPTRHSAGHTGHYGRALSGRNALLRENIIPTACAR
jgi:hypothetical protein